MSEFEGHERRECGEHRTTGSRAWCHDCHEWCYPDAPCHGCEDPILRDVAHRARDLLRAGIVANTPAQVCAWDDLLTALALAGYEP